MGRWIAGLLMLFGALLPGMAGAQQNGSIAGVVTDSTASLLPGVSVQASSDALIEKTRNAVTDGRGQYRIVDLRPGVYGVTFTLPGFTTVRRDGIELTVGFTASVNAELKVGNVSETVTVQGATPVVDIQNVNQQRVMTRDVIEAVPSGRGIANYATLIPGVIMSNSSSDPRRTTTSANRTRHCASIRIGRPVSALGLSTGNCCSPCSMSSRPGSVWRSPTTAARTETSS